MSTRSTKIIRRRVVAGAVVLAAAVSAPVAVAATSSSSPRAGVHTQVQKDGSCSCPVMTVACRCSPAAGRLARLASDTKTLIETAITRFIEEVPALAPLKLVVGTRAARAR